MSPPTRCVCEKCDFRGFRTDLLRAPNPFAPERTIIGCPQCKGSGYAGRMAVFEFQEHGLDEEVERAMAEIRKRKPGGGQ